MKYLNYEITREDEHNWKAVRRDEVVAERDIRNPSNGEIVHKKGSTYTREVFKGFHGDLCAALWFVSRDNVGMNCTSIDQVLEGIEDMRAEIMELKECRESLDTP